MTKRVGIIIAVSIIVIIGISVLVSRSFSCNGGPSEIKNPDTFIIAVIADISSLDPAYGYDTASSGQIQNIYETLIKFDGQSTSDFIPCLATEWTISEDGKTYRHLKGGWFKTILLDHNGCFLSPFLVWGITPLEPTMV